MLKQCLIIGTAAALVGCESLGMNDNSARISAQAPTDAELAAYAGGHQYPANQQARNDIRAAAIVNRGDGLIKLYNFSNRPLDSVDVWVNQSYVQHIRGLPAGSAPLVIRFRDLYNQLGQRFSSHNEQVRTVQVESNGALYTLEGPGAD